MKTWLCYIRHYYRWWCLAVSFPVGIGSGLLPEPMVIEPVQNSLLLPEQGTGDEEAAQ